MFGILGKKENKKGGAIPIGLLASIAAPILGKVAKPVLGNVFGKGRRRRQGLRRRKRR